MVSLHIIMMRRTTMEQTVQNKLLALPVLDADKATHGPLGKFRDRDWLLQEMPISPEEKFLVLGIRKVVQRWEDGRVVEEILDQPNKELPNPDKLNTAIPMNTWELGADNN